MGAIKRALSAVIKPMLREVSVVSAREVTPRFRHIVLCGESLIGASCNPGDKVQVLIDGDFRTYSPFGFDGAAGRFELLVYLHGDAPGAAWARAVRAGDPLHLFGPRGSIAADGPVVIVGDETTIAVARALANDTRTPRAFLEVGSEDEARVAAEAIGLAGATLVSRKANDAHHAALEVAVREALEADPASALVLTGKAQTIQALRASLRARPTEHRSQKTKAYWAPGKRGLD